MMPPSAFTRITMALVELLEVDPPVADVIFRARTRPVPKNAGSAINVQFSSGRPAEGVINGAPVDWMSKFTIECLARAAADQSPDDAVDPLLTAVYERIAADTTLGGLVDHIGAPAIEAEYSAEGERTGWVCLTYPIEHRTQNLNLE